MPQIEHDSLVHQAAQPHSGQRTRSPGDSPGSTSYSAVRSGQAAANRMILWPGPSTQPELYGLPLGPRGASASPKHQAAAT